MTRSPTPSRRIRSSASPTVISASRSGKSFRACSITGELKSGMPPRSGIPNLYLMNDPFAAQNLFRIAEVIADVGLGADPIDVARDSDFEFDLRFVAGRANLRRIAGEMAHFAGSKFAACFWFDVDLEQSRKNLRHFADRCSLTAADIHRESIEAIGLRGQQVRARDVFDE